MMLTYFSFLILALSSWSALACQVHLPEHLVVLGDVSDFTPVINHTGCEKEAMDEINKTLVSFEGKVTSFQFAEILKLKNHVVNIHPQVIQVQHLKHLIREQLHLPAGIHLRASEALNAANYLALSSGDKVEVECLGCLYGSKQPLNVNIVSFDGTQKSLTVRADFKKMVRAFRVQTFHPAFTELSSASLKEELVEEIPHTDLLTDLETIRFYKLNKPVRAGELLKKSDLNALNLVRAGLKTEVVIENSLLKLKTHGICRSNGTLGEFVEVFHPQKNKKYLGKVVDINKVLVEL